MALRDKVIATTPEGKRIFGYNDNGQPICYSKRPGKPGLRCQAMHTMSNGRCVKHGGKSPSGIMHWNAQHLRTANSLPKHLQSDMLAAGRDPDLLSNNHEIELLDVYEKKLKEELDNGLSENGIKKLGQLMSELEQTLEDGGEITEEDLLKLITVYKGAISQEATWRKIKNNALDRAKLTDVVHRREKDLKQFMRADQVYALVTSVAHACKEGIIKVFAQIDKKYILIDKNTKQPVSSIDPSIRLDFMNDVHHKLGSLIGQPKSSNNLQPKPDDDVIDG